MNCPCNSKKLYNECCKKAHDNIQLVTTAEALMRSRYSAFVLANIDYLQLSHHSSTRPSKREKKEILNWTNAVSWLKLEILQKQKGGINENEGLVEFKAYYMENGLVNCIHEASIFCKENGHWVYLEGSHSR